MRLPNVRLAAIAPWRTRRERFQIATRWRRHTLAWLLLPGIVAATGRVPAFAGPLPTFLLIDDSGVNGFPRLGGCDRELASLHARLLRNGATSQLLVDPSGDVLRRELLRFAGHGPDLPHVFVVCGYAAANGNELFILPNDATPGNLGRGAVNVAVFLRLLGGRDGATVLDLHPAADPQVAAAATAWSNQAGSSQAGPADRRIVSVSNDPNQAPSVQHLAQSDVPSINGLIPGRAVQPDATAMPASPSQPPSAPSSVTAAAPEAPAAPKPAPKPTPSEAASPRPPAPPAPIVSARSVVHGPTLAKRRATHATRTADASHKHVDDVTRRIQVALLARGLFMRTVSGMDDRYTRASIRHFQLLLGQPPTGHLTAEELKQLIGG